MNVNERSCNGASFLCGFTYEKKFAAFLFVGDVAYYTRSDFSEEFSSSVIHILLLRYLHLNLDNKLSVCYENDHVNTYTLLKNHNNSNKLAATITFFFHEDRKTLAAKNLCVIAKFHL